MSGPIRPSWSNLEPSCAILKPFRAQDGAKWLKISPRRRFWVATQTKHIISIGFLMILKAKQKPPHKLDKGHFRPKHKKTNGIVMVFWSVLGNIGGPTSTFKTLKNQRKINTVGQSNPNKAPRWP